MFRTAVKTAALLTVLAFPVACDSGTEPGPVPASIDLTARIDILPAGQTFPLETVVEDASGNPIPDADVQFGSSNNAIATVDGSGVVTGTGEGDVTISATAGSVSDEVSLFIVRFDDPCAEALHIGLGESVRASLQAGDCVEIVDDGSFVDLWFFELTQRSDVTVDLSSADFDAYLWVDKLENDVLVNVGEDDNSGTGTDARVLATLDPGTYFIIANHHPGADGVYTLSVTTAVAADPALRATAVDRTRALPEVRVRKQRAAVR
ncbi:MAG: Ig-like domain-containing protein [Gemmatimonadetes bacterium]|nr:Ig-like domain-containing protein [Gemmatimonadota bacterium]